MADRQKIKPKKDFFRPFVEWLDSGDAAPVIKPQPAVREETVSSTSVPTSEMNPDYTWPNLLKYAKKKYGKTEQEVKDTLKAGGFTTLAADKYVAARAVLDQRSWRPTKTRQSTRCSNLRLTNQRQGGV